MSGRIALWLGLILFAGGATAQDWPAYRCHPPREGYGSPVATEVLTLVSDTRKLPATEAIGPLEEKLRASRTGSLQHGVLSKELAWHYDSAGRREDARRAALTAIGNRYVTGTLVDGMRALLAQTYADEDNWAAVVGILQPQVDSGCRPVPAATRRLLATAHFKRGDMQDALKQIDLVEPKDNEEGLILIKLAIAIECAESGASNCASRLLGYAQWPQPSENLQHLLNTAIERVAGDSLAREPFEQARRDGVLDADFHVIPQAAPDIEDVVPIERAMPVYPPQALRSGQTGYVVMEVTVGPDGNVIEAKPVDSAPKGVFEKAAVAAALKSRFRPRVVDGVPVHVIGRYTVNFVLATP